MTRILALGSPNAFASVAAGRPPVRDPSPIHHGQPIRYIEKSDHSIGFVRLTYLGQEMS